MIEVKGLSFGYKDNLILDNISFTAETGKITYLAGENGAGKTTFIKCATGLLTADAGEVLYDGMKFNMVRESFSICFDTPPVYKGMSCNHNLQVLYDVDYKSDKAKQLLSDIGIDERLRKGAAGKLSYGQRHRLGIAGAILRQPKYIILDEPDLGLDPKAWDKVSREIVSLRSSGAAVVITGQNFEQLEDIADKVVVLSGKKVKADMSVDEFKEKYNASCIKEAFLKIV